MKISEVLKGGKEHEDVNILFTFSLLKPLHVNWMIILYDERTTTSGKNVTLKGCKKQEL